MNDNVNSSTLKQLLQDLLAKHQLSISELKHQLHHSFFPQIKKLPDAEQEQCIQLMLLLAGTDLAGQTLVKYVAGKKVPLAPLASYRQLLTIATLRRQLSGFQPEWVLNNKKRGFVFVDALAVRRPTLLQQRVSADALEFSYPCAIKPVDGAASKGVYLAISPAEFISVRNGEKLSSAEEVKAAMLADLTSKRVAKDLWQAEELIADIEPFEQACDLKFYCFYGKVGLVLEVERSAGGRYCEWLSDGKRADTGRYSDVGFEGKGFSAEAIALAEKISAEIPSPFMRIDFLKTKQELVFGEFTPRPGKYDEFNPHFDNYLGKLYLEAEAKLQKDLLAGKRFDVFSSLSQG